MKTLFALILLFAASAQASLSYTLMPAGPGCVEIHEARVEWPFPYVGVDDVVTQVRFYFSQDQVTPDSKFIAVSVSANGKSFSPTRFCDIPAGTWFTKYGFMNQYGKLVEFAENAQRVIVP